MLIWIVAGILTFAACLSVMSPLLRRQEARPADADFDLEVYQDQLVELERDVTRGAIGRAEADQARAEIGRRILKLDGDRVTGGQAANARMGGLVAGFAILAVPVTSWGIYAAIGSPHLPAQPLHARLNAEPAQSSMSELVRRAEAHLAANPDDGRGWEVLAPIYYRAGRYEEAATAYGNTIRLLGSNSAREAGLGEALAAAADGIVTDDAQAALERALEDDEHNPKARFLLAAALAQQGRAQEAADAWRAMLDGLAPDSPWRGAVGQALAQLAGAEELPGQAGAGPTAEEIEAAASIPDKDREAMIDSMVAGLDQRLRDNPRDPEGWHRLVQSYIVLGKLEAANDALVRGLDALAADSEEAAALAAFAAQHGVSVAEPAEDGR